MSEAVDSTWRRETSDVVWRVLVAIGGGALVGMLVGGIGGRLAMLVLRVGSDPAVLGAQTDDGFEIGVFTTATFFLIVVTAGLGAGTGLVYLILRTALPRRGRVIVFGVFVTLFRGADTLAPGSFDFSALDPKVFAVVSFIALQGVAALLIALLVERLLRVEPWSTRPLAVVLALAALPLTPVLPVIGIVVAAMIGLRRTPAVALVIGRIARVAVPVLVVALSVKSGLEIWDDARLIVD